MSDSRLFIYDPESNSAVCIAKGYAEGWSCPTIPYIDAWFDDNREFNIPNHTRLMLKTEFDLPEGATIAWEQSK